MQTLTGSLGNLWKKLTVTMANRTDPYQVVLEATVRGNNGNLFANRKRKMNRLCDNIH